MKRRSGRWVVPAVVAGVAIGSGIAFVRSNLSKRHPDDLLIQRSINWALDRALRKARQQGRIALEPGAKYVVFSDHHKGARNDADDFEPCEQTYLAALDYYLDGGYTLIVMGDAEELWEEDVDDVMECYDNVFRAEAGFYPERYMRIHGNHDDPWKSEWRVLKYLDPYFPGVQFRDAAVFEFREDGEPAGEVFLAHGYQGTIDSDWFAFVGQVSLPIYREFQKLTHLGRTTAAHDNCLRAEHDSQMYRWARKKAKLFLVAGHTHRPVWSSRTHLEKLLWDLYELSRLPPDERPDDYEQQLAELNKDIRRREEKYPPCRDTIKTRPCYFNTGCCRFEDGDVTGIEFDDKDIRLIKWGEGEDGFRRTVLEGAPLSEIFAFL